MRTIITEFKTIAKISLSHSVYLYSRAKNCFFFVKMFFPFI
nr:MAG TPA: hypothetical protein [Caudoviricetes sp.]